jgi:hypothetical protein
LPWVLHAGSLRKASFVVVGVVIAVWEGFVLVGSALENDDEEDESMVLPALLLVVLLLLLLQLVSVGLGAQGLTGDACACDCACDGEAETGRDSGGSITCRTGEDRRIGACKGAE